MCMLLHLSFKKIVPFVLKVVIWALKAKKWPCPPLPIKAQNTEKKLGIDLSFSSSLVCAGFRRKKLTYLSYHPMFSVVWSILQYFSFPFRNTSLKRILKMYNTYLEHCIKMANDNIKDQSNSPKGPYVAIEINQEPNTG